MRYLVVAVGMCLLCQTARSQDNTAAVEKIINLPASFFNKVNHKTAALEARLTRQSERYLTRLQRHEKKLHKKILKKDPLSAQRVFGPVDSLYNGLKTIGKTDSLMGGNSPSVYNGHLDSMRTALQFLQQNNSLPTQLPLQGTMRQYSQLQGKLDQTEAIKKYLQQRQQRIKELLEKTGMIKQFRQFQKEVYYYKAEIDEYKKALDNPSKIEAKALEMIVRIPAFREFFNQHSQLAGLFRLPGNNDITASAAPIPGLQTRSMITDNLQQHFGSAPGVQQALQQNVQSAQSQLATLKNKFTQSGNDDSDIPNFRPNSQKTKSFWKRIEVGTNIQTASNNHFFPVTSDIGLSLGYKINDKSVIGIGSSYKMGWGSGFKNIKLTHEGIGLRSFLDWKIKGSMYASGGFEYNYQPLNTDRLTAPSTGGGWGEASSWQQSGLLGISKIVSLKSKWFKKTKLQLLWDFLSYRQVPVTQPVKFRVGYNF